MGTDQCWCSTVKISPEALAAMSADARHRICGRASHDANP